MDDDDQRDQRDAQKCLKCNTTISSSYVKLCLECSKSFKFCNDCNKCYNKYYFPKHSCKSQSPVEGTPKEGTTSQLFCVCKEEKDDFKKGARICRDCHNKRQKEKLNVHYVKNLSHGTIYQSIKEINITFKDLTYEVLPTALKVTYEFIINNN